VTLSLLAAVIVIQQVVVPIKATRRNPFLVLFQPGFSQSAALYAKENRFEMAAAEMRKLRNRASELEFPEIAASAGLKEAEYLGMTAQRLIEQKKMREAAELTAQAEKAYGQHVLEKGPAFNLGNLYFDMGRYKEASSYFDEFLKTAPNDPRAEFVRQRRRAIPAGVR
jgi:tetratricopeptide (TPR) repeat protein